MGGFTGPGRGVRGSAALGAGVLALALGAAGCGGAVAGDGTFTVGHLEPDHLLPANTTSSYAFDVLSELFDNLVGLTKDGRTYDLAAESVTTRDQRHWTIKIRPGRFHNGERVTAASFADAWSDAAYGPNAYNANAYFAHFEGYAELNPANGARPAARRLAGVRAVDDATLKVTLTAPFNQFRRLLTYPAFAPLPKAGLANPAAFERHPIGNGPYRMSGNWERNRRIRLVAAPGYTGPRVPRNKGVIWLSYASADTAYTDLRAGRIDVLQSIPPGRVPEAERLLGTRILRRRTGTADYLGLPLFDRRFADPDLRRAISMAIDRQGVNKAVFNGGYQPADSLLPAIIPGHRPGACGRACAYDPAEARRLYARSGGFRGTLELYFSNAEPAHYQWMQIIANSLRQNLGIRDVRFRQVPASDYFAMLNRHDQKGPYRQNWEADYPSAQNYLENMWGSKGNRMGWKSAEFDALIAEANAAGDERAALRLYGRAEDVALRAMPLIPLWTWAGEGGRSARVGNVTVTPYSTGLLADEVTVR